MGVELQGEELLMRERGERGRIRKKEGPGCGGVGWFEEGNELATLHTVVLKRDREEEARDRKGDGSMNHCISYYYPSFSPTIQCRPTPPPPALGDRKTN